MSRFYTSLKKVFVPGVGRMTRISRWMPGGAMLVEYKMDPEAIRVDEPEAAPPDPILRETALPSECRS